jgi:hypothetical protein
MKRKAASAPEAWWIPWTAVAAGFGAALVCAWWVVQGRLPLGHIRVWVWHRREPLQPPLPWTVPASLVLLVLVLLAFDALREAKLPSRRSCAVLVACLTVGCALQMTAMMLDDPEYPLRAGVALLADVTMGYYAQARGIVDTRAWLADVEGRTDLLRVPERVATHPPGPVLYFRWTRGWLQDHPALEMRLQTWLERWGRDPGLATTKRIAYGFVNFGLTAEDLVIALWSGIALTLSAALVVPLAFWAGTVAVDRSVGLSAAALATAIPSLLCFNPSVDAPNAPACLLLVALWFAALRGGGLPAGVLCGAAGAAALFWSFGVTAAAFVLAVIWLLQARHVGGGWRPRGIAELTRHPRWAPVTSAAVGFLAVAVAQWIAGYNLPLSFTRSLAVHRMVMSGRPYLTALGLNAEEFALFAGPALVVTMLAGTIRALRHPELAGAGHVGLGALVTVAALLLSAQTRGEVGRIWGFVMPLLTLPAAAWLRPLRGWSLMSAGTLLVLGQLVVTGALNSCVKLVSLW